MTKELRKSSQVEALSCKQLFHFSCQKTNPAERMCVTCCCCCHSSQGIVKSNTHLYSEEGRPSHTYGGGFKVWQHSLCYCSRARVLLMTTISGGENFNIASKSRWLNFIRAVIGYFEIDIFFFFFSQKRKNEKSFVRKSSSLRAVISWKSASLVPSLQLYLVAPVQVWPWKWLNSVPDCYSSRYRVAVTHACFVSNGRLLTNLKQNDLLT